MTSARLRRALDRIDEINRADPHEIRVRGEARPKELTHAAMVSAWIERLRPDADDALRIAAHGHHVRRWAIPRAASIRRGVAAICGGGRPCRNCTPPRWAR